MVQPTLKKMSLKEANESFSSNSSDLFMKIEDYKSRNSMNGEHTNQEHPTNRNYAKNEPYTSPNKLKIGNKVLLDATDPYIVTAIPNEEIFLTVFSIFPFSTVEVSHPKFDTFKVNNTRLKPYCDEIDSVSIKTCPRTQACLRPCKNRTKDFPNTGYD
ncbi:hypothetical protein GOBAR_AA25830 [Gossypium barbadense]|uniref:Uncharacterized protein n=1 Tax=Gossypium barbadense TaxID=3634 RepID=A0A2P5WUQ8_GOSBA|nr:hypothetical protein GOBAR_AA25830 [Gossypium barbadense]